LEVRKGVLFGEVLIESDFDREVVGKKLDFGTVDGFDGRD
jgi:hypothetical protein